MPSINSQQGRAQIFSGTGSGDNVLCFTTGNVQQHSVFQLMTTDGNVDVEVTLDGSNWTTVAINLEDQGSTDPVTYVAATAATGRMYRFRGKFTAVRVRAAGGAATAIMLAGSD